MRIKKRLQLNAAVSVLTAFIIVFMLFTGLYRINKANDLSVMASDIITNDFERVTLRNDYLRNKTTRSKEQWFAKHEQLRGLLKSASENFRDADDRKTIGEIINNHESIGKIFSAIVANSEKKGSTPVTAELSHEVEDRLLSQLNMRVYNEVIHSLRLLESSKEARASAIRLAGEGIIGVLAVIIAAAFISSWTMGQAITDRIRRLRDGAAVIGGGGLDHHIDIKGDDEFVELSEAFNTMTARLRGSYQDLEREVEERRRAEDKLRESADELQATNTDLGDSRRAAINLMEDALAARRQAEEATAGLRESESRFQTMANAMPQLAWIARADGFIFWYNQRWYDYSGTTPEQMEGWGWQSVHDPDELPKVLERWQASVATGETFEMTFPLRGADGVFRQFLTRGFPLKDVAGRVLQWFGTNTDVSELKRAAEALARAHEQTEADRKRLEAILEISPVGVVLLKAGTSRFSLINRRAAEIYGTDYDGFDLWDHIARVKLLQPDGTPFPVEDLPVSHAWRGEESHNVEMTIERANGVRVPLLVNTAPLRDNEGKVIMAVVVFDDITERKLAEEQIKASLAEKEVMLREIHHRVKNNLQVISSLISLQADTLADEGMRVVFGDVRDRVRAMALVHEKLYQTGDLAQLNFADYAASLLQYLWRSHGALAEKVRLNLEVAPVALPIEAAVPCGLTLNELAGNALKHAFPDKSGGEVTVGLELDPATGSACLRVSDNGVGLPPGLEWRQSRSLGLRLVQMLAGQLRGTVETRNGPGAEFRVTFPLKGFQS
jgi:PAS domain S-box-containing protein